MKLIFHGGEREVGRNCVELVTSKARFLFDAGIKLGEQTQYPEEIKDIKKIDAVILTHGHLDHCGALPYLQSKGLNCPIYSTPLTKDFAKLLLKDFYKIESLTHIPPYKKESTVLALDLFRTKIYNQEFSEKDTHFKFIDAGHVPGSAYALVESEGKKIVYTGDIKLSETQLLKGANISVRDIDALIMETTYGNKEHTDRKTTEREFLDEIKRTLKKGGKVFIPAFGLGRTQEILLLVHKERWNVPVYLDGMGTDMTNLTIEANGTKDKEKLIQARNKTIFISGGKPRQAALQHQGIFIASAGMLTGGPMIEYLKEGHQDPKNSILLTGYVDTGTNGRLLLDEGSIFIEGRKTKVHAEYKQFDFSAHAGLSELKDLVRRLNPGKIILIHGEPAGIDYFAGILREKGKEVFVPGIGDEINI